MHADTLLISASFFGYAAAIRTALERRGRQVCWYEDRPATDNATKALLRVAPALLAPKAKAYFSRIADEVRGTQITEVLVIKGEALDTESIRILRAALPKARFTLYFWDSYMNMPQGSAEKVAQFDRAFTFDPDDAAADARLAYRPLFFIDAYLAAPRSVQDIDVLFVGTAHSSRYAVLRRIARALPSDLRFDRVLYLPSQKIYFARRVFDPAFWSARRDEFVFQPLPTREVTALMSRARVVVDIEREVQSGFTIRTLEALAAGRKILTTNARVAEADFYDPCNVQVIDRNTPRIDERFLRLPGKPPPPALLRRYSLDGWLDEVLPATSHQPAAAVAA